MKTIKIELPYPPSALKPNARPCWQVKYGAAKQYKLDCFWLTVNATPIKRPVFGEIINLSITFHPKTKNTVDLDNAVAAFKSGMDGIAEAWRVNDSRFRWTSQIGSPVKGGAIIVQYEDA